MFLITTLLTQQLFNAVYVFYRVVAPALIWIYVPFVTLQVCILRTHQIYAIIVILYLICSSMELLVKHAH